MSYKKKKKNQESTSIASCVLIFMFIKGLKPPN